MFKKKKKAPKPYVDMSLGEVFRLFLISKLPRQKQKIADQAIIPQPKQPDDISYIAIVLDGVVEDVMRAQNRLAALLLSEPQFIEFDPNKDRPKIGVTKYENNSFVYPKEELMTDKEIADTLDKMVGTKNEDKK